MGLAIQSAHLQQLHHCLNRVGLLARLAHILQSVPKCLAFEFTLAKFLLGFFVSLGLGLLLGSLGSVHRLDLDKQLLIFSVQILDVALEIICFLLHAPVNV